MNFSVRLVTCRSDQQVANVSARFPDAFLINTYGSQVARNGVIVTLAAFDKLLVTAVLGRLGGHVTVGELTDLAYGHRRDGGPDSPREVIRNRLNRLRPVLALLGYRLDIGSVGICAYPVLFAERVAA